MQIQTVMGEIDIGQLRRDVTAMQEIAEQSEMQIVRITGFYFGALGLPVYWRARTKVEIAELYIRGITQGVGNTGIRAGAIKRDTLRTAGKWPSRYTCSVHRSHADAARTRAEGGRYLLYPGRQSAPLLRRGGRCLGQTRLVTQPARPKCASA